MPSPGKGGCCASVPLTGQAGLGMKNSRVLLLGSSSWPHSEEWVGQPNRHAWHSRNRQCWHMLIHKLGRAKKAKEASMVLETKMPWSSLQLLQRPASTCPHFPHLFQVFTSWLHFHHKKKKKMPQLGKDRSGWGKRFARRPHLLP